MMAFSRLPALLIVMMMESPGGDDQGDGGELPQGILLDNQIVS